MNTKKMLEDQQWLNDKLRKSSIINEIMGGGFIPIVEEDNIIVYRVKKNSEFLKLKSKIFDELSEEVIYKGFYNYQNVLYFNTSSGHFISLNMITLDDVREYQSDYEKNGCSIIQLLKDNGCYIDEYNILKSLRSFLVKNGYHRCRVMKYSKLYQLMNSMDKCIDLNIIISCLCEYLGINYNYADTLTVYGINSNETSKERDLSKNEKINYIKEIIESLDIKEVDSRIYGFDKDILIELAKRNTDIISTEGYNELSRILSKNKIKKIKKYISIL